ncbi:EAL domain-containing protein [Cohnella silvisoli]|uniref:EAL domain-containing protein n=1 Tax=Cohnella silvisoli TaxID=2873699 RepID=A0ABV1KS70_9BACL|nr:EAL domain-containing protein [Cohnella silvisoli]MCD9022586.1 EAL domain-containing protein [Cohnella silvisoli]
MVNLSDSKSNTQGTPKGKLLAYYQPIIALETRSIVGYEALGRQFVDGNVRSLGPFFSDSSISVEEHVRIDRLLREQAINKMSKLPDPPTLFINLKPSWIYQHYKSTGELHTLQLLDKHGMDPSKICIEITEEEFNGSMSELNEIINLYRAQGCRIAIDDIGTGFSNFDRIAQIQPNLLKIDIHLMKKSAHHSGYLGVLRSFSTLAEQIGASLLVEGVETSQDLKRAIQIGARYVQGYLFAPAEPELRLKDAFTPLIEAELDEHRRNLRATKQHWEELGKRLVDTIQASEIGNLLEAAPDSETEETVFDVDSEQADHAIGQLLPTLNESCMRVYLCRNDGIQLSANHIRDSGDTWRMELEYRNADWSWRPYFIPHLSHENSRVEAKVSTLYADLDTHAWIRTFSIPIGKELILLLDVADSNESNE